jgi:D-alanyl-lipoteichoic acid acyltransferase DltB (MBOAT superfamily)
MLFNSWGYLLFMLIAVPAQRLVPERLRVALLGLFSVAFYAMWRWEFCSLLLISSVLDYHCAKQIHAHDDDEPTRKRWLLLSLVVNLGLLVVFKYSYFLWDNASMLAGVAGASVPPLRSLGVDIVLPLGISFYTFQTISYTIDVYRRINPPTTSFAAFFTYVTFWPQLIAGPVLRAGEVIPQLVERQPFRWTDVGVGAERVMRGLFKKVVIADTIAPMVDAAFGRDPTGLTAFDTWVATFMFGFQIYFDFAGYSDIAIGSARILGLRFPDNFNWPYLATSPRDFWKRWHISLSSWIRDYLYLPLTGQKFRTKSLGGLEVGTKPAKRASSTRALFMTWFIMGLWHGAGWNFAIWGLYHALVIFVYRRLAFLQRLADRAPLLGWALLLPVSMAGWIPFRAESVTQTVQMFGHILDPTAYTFAGRSIAGYTYIATIVLLGGMLASAGVHKWVERADPKPVVRGVGVAVSTAVMAVAVITLLRTVRQFIYFQF